MSTKTPIKLNPKSLKNLKLITTTKTTPANPDTPRLVIKLEPEHLQKSTTTPSSSSPRGNDQQRQFTTPKKKSPTTTTTPHTSTTPSETPKITITVVNTPKKGFKPVKNSKKTKNNKKATPTNNNDNQPDELSSSDAQFKKGQEAYQTLMKKNGGRGQRTRKVGVHGKTTNKNKTDKTNNNNTNKNNKNLRTKKRQRNTTNLTLPTTDSNTMYHNDNEEHHPLWSPFYFWIYKKYNNDPRNPSHESLPQATTQNSSEQPTPPVMTTKEQEYQAYLDNFLKLGPIHTVEEFFQIYTYLKRPNHNTDNTYHLFRSHIEPTWESPENAAGGRFVLKVKKGCGSRIYELALLTFIGNESNAADEICGVVVQIKRTEDILSIWVKSRKQQDLQKSLGFVKNLMTRAQGIPIHSFDFVPHPTEVNIQHDNEMQLQQEKRDEKQQQRVKK